MPGSTFLNTLKRAASRRARTDDEGQAAVLQRPLDAAGSEASAVAKVAIDEKEAILYEGYLEKHVTAQREGESVQEWSQRYVKLTPTRLLFSFNEEGPVREDVALEDIDILVTLEEDAGKGDKNDGKKKEGGPGRGGRSSLLTGLEWDNGIRIYTAKYGRNFYLRSSDKAEGKAWMNAIETQRDNRVQEIARLGQKTWAQRWRPVIGRISDSMEFQTFVAVLLFLNFSLNIYEVEVKPPEGSELEATLESLDVAFTMFYVIELFLNLFVHWWREFLFNGWSVFDSICVLSSVVGMILTAAMDGKIDLSIIRSLRIFKIVRIFSRLKALQRVVTAITSTVLPLFNTFLIFVVVIAIYSVLASQLYGVILPQRFGSFTAASLTMFQLATGDGWLTDVVRPLMELGYEQQGPTFNIWASIFFISFILFVMVVLINVAVAVLLEGFLSAISGMEASERSYESAVEYNKIAGPLDPLLATLANFHSEEHLSSQIALLFGFLDIDDGGSISFEEFKQGVETIDSKPPMLVMQEDFDAFTLGGALCKEDGSLDVRSFDKCMRLQMRNYAQRLIAHQMTEAVRNQQNDSAEYFAHKVLISEIFKLANKVGTISDEIKDLSAGGSGRTAGSQSNTPSSPARVQWQDKPLVATMEKRTAARHPGELDGIGEDPTAPLADMQTLMAMISELKTISLDTQSRVQRCEELLAVRSSPHAPTVSGEAAKVSSNHVPTPLDLPSVKDGSNVSRTTLRGRDAEFTSSPVDVRNQSKQLSTATAGSSSPTRDQVGFQKSPLSGPKSKSQIRPSGSSPGGANGTKTRSFGFTDLPFSDIYSAARSPNEDRSLPMGRSIGADVRLGGVFSPGGITNQGREGDGGDDGIKYGRARRAASPARLEQQVSDINSAMDRMSVELNGRAERSRMARHQSGGTNTMISSERGEVEGSQGMAPDIAGAFPTPSKWT